MPQKDPLKLKAYLAKWRTKNREKLREKSRQWAKKHADKKRAYAKEHSAEIVARVKQWRLENPERLREQRRTYRHKHHAQRIKYQRDSRRKYPHKQRDRQLWHYFGMRLEEYEELLKLQKGVCAICRNKETRIRNGKLIPLSVDHNSKTGEVRELLCSACNTAIGLLGHNIERILNAAVYLSIWD